MSPRHSPAGRSRLGAVAGAARLTVVAAAVALSSSYIASASSSTSAPGTANPAGSAGSSGTAPDDSPTIDVVAPPIDTRAPGDANPPTNAAPITPGDVPLPMPLPFPVEPAVEPVVWLGRITIPALGVDEELFEGVALHTLDRGPGHAPGTAMPGQLGNVVVGGHRVSHSAPFHDLDRLVPGDEVIFQYNFQRFVYLVETIEIVLPTEARVVYPRWAYTATLFACHPLHSTRERIIVHLRLAT